MSAVIVVTARAESTRLPGKMLLPLNGKPIIQHVIERAQSCRAVSDVVLMTPSSPANEPIAAIGGRLGVKVYRDSGKDRILGLLEACRSVKANVCATMDGDDPLCDPYLIGEALRQLQQTQAEVIHTPKGMICGAFTLATYTATLDLAVNCKTAQTTQAILPYLQDVTDLVAPLEEYDPIYYDPDIRLTLDYQEDYTFFRRVFQELNIQTNDMGLYGIAAWLKENPDIVAINKHRAQDWADNQRGMK